ncbi:FecR domain-containing protein [Verrucomicrobium spinosum]|uniref:FecR domain-containing protein n=1 Tax=Verrucomicrobium spinosum TaxID=2736 RepID=UPI0009467D3A|nr:FecR domain-containing protein [Verrucomicrobium spinosum]
MNTITRTLPLALLGSALLFPAGLSAASYTKAEVTRLHNEVKVLKENAAPREAVVGDEISSVTSVATGAASRAELKFPDNSLTRLGANSRFTIRGDKRTLDLDQGVMLLQVPKQMGGAKVRTAAVTAAVTGTTVLFEYLPGGFVKLIVIEGVVDLYFNKEPGKFTHITAGQMIIMKTDSNQLPTPVDVDLSLLLKTSKLINGDDESMPNFMEVVKALEFQQKELKKGDLVATNFVLPGRGTLVELSNNTALNVINTIAIKDAAPGGNSPQGNGGPTGNNGNNGGIIPPDYTGEVPLIVGASYLGDNSLVETNPHVTVHNSQGEEIRFAGQVYNAKSDRTSNRDFTLFPLFTFGKLEPVENLNFKKFLTNTTDEAPTKESELWAVFKFENLVVNGTPEFDFPIYTFVDGPALEDPIRNVIFSAQKDILFAAQYAPGTEPPYWSEDDNAFDLSYNYDVEKVGFYSQDGSITVNEGFDVKGGNQDMAFVARGLASDVNLYGRVSTEGDVLVSAGQDINITYRLSGNFIDAAAGRDINISNGARVKATQGIDLRAKGSINVADTSTLKLICANEDAVVKLLSQGGNINIGDENEGLPASCRAEIKGPIIDIEALAADEVNGQIRIFNSNVTASNILRARTMSPMGGSPSATAPSQEPMHLSCTQRAPMGASTSSAIQPSTAMKFTSRAAPSACPKA